MKLPLKSVGILMHLSSLFELKSIKIATNIVENYLIDTMED